MKYQNLILLLFLFLTWTWTGVCGNCTAQTIPLSSDPLSHAADTTKNTFENIFILPDENKKGIGLYVQGKYSREYSMNFVGLQIKRYTMDSDVGVAFGTDQEFSINYSKDGSDSYASVDGNAGFLYLPYTLIFTLGAGGNYTQSLMSESYILSVYPKISLSFGGISVLYNYKIPLVNNIKGDFSKNSLTIAFGPRIWKKK